MQKVVTLNTCSDVACLAFQLPFATHHNRFFFRPTNANPQLALFRATNVCILQGSVVTFSGKVGKLITVCFLLR